MITSPAFAGKRYAVLGLARSGVATVEALLASGACVVAWDADEGRREALLEAPPLQGRGWGGGLTSAPVASASGLPHPNPSPEGEGLSVADPLTLDLAGFDGVVVSPGVPLNRHPIKAHAEAAGVPVIGDVELFAQARASLPPHKVVGITGTNGKSTTTALIHHICQTAGVPSLMGGNIGLPILSRDPLTPNAQGAGVYVLELSSYQIDLTFTLDCDVAVLTNITPDHLDRYDGFEAYAASKARLFDMQRAENGAIIAGDDNETRRVAALEWQRRGQDPNWILVHAADIVDQTSWPALQGPHNAQNAACAIATAKALGIKEQVVEQALRTYPGLPHRMERVATRDGVLYVNDSKATNSTATAPALGAYEGIHWIVGGLAKTRELDACVPYFANVRAAYTIGDAGPLFAELLRPHMAVTESGTLAKAVRTAALAARDGEVVMLSPACASFDQFADYEARGEAFRAAVGAL